MWSEGNLYTVAFPMAEENNGNGTVAPAFALPGATPWRTITIGETLETDCGNNCCVGCRAFSL